MPNLDFLIHLPLLKIESDNLPFAEVTLHKLPFSKYDEITLGAFRDHKIIYEATEPVFLYLSHPISEEGLERRAHEASGVIEIKLPSTREEMLDRLGLYSLNLALRSVAERVWSALLLAFPAAAFPPPRWSQSFIAIDGGFTLPIKARPAVAARVQGEADHEYLFFPEASCSHIPDAEIARASALAPCVVRWEQVPELRAALEALQTTGLPTFSRQDRMTIAVQALESLLMPDVYKQLRRTFVQRILGLLEGAYQADSLTAVARELFDRRSESIHGAMLRADETVLRSALAESILAASIRQVGSHIDAGKSIQDIRMEIDTRSVGVTSGVGKAKIEFEPVPIALASNHRLARPTPTSNVLPVGSFMAAPEGQVCCWSPLVGLDTVELHDPPAMLLGEAPAPVLMPLSPAELWELEERDVRRDFFAEFVQHGHSMAMLMTMMVPDRPATAEGATQLLERMRDLGVIVLRLRGYDQFHDPQLFGSVIFEGPRRLRRPTVLRQTIAEFVRHRPTQSVGPADAPDLASLWADIWNYETRAPSAAIENIFSLFRRTFDRHFLRPPQRALILITLLESLLGRFRSPEADVQLEDVVEKLIGARPEAQWFRTEGRKFRNRVAHGALTAEDVGEPTERVSRIVTCLVRELIRARNGAGLTQQEQTPPALLWARATARAPDY